MQHITEKTYCLFILVSHKYYNTVYYKSQHGVNSFLSGKKRIPRFALCLRIAFSIVLCIMTGKVCLLLLLHAYQFATNPSKSNTNGSEPHQAPLSTVGVGGEGEVVLEINDDVLDMAELVLGHQVLYRPGSGQITCRYIQAMLI